MTTRVTAILLTLVAGLVACSNGGNKPGPLLPDAPGSQILTQGQNHRLGPVSIGVKTVADGKAGLSIVDTTTGESSAAAPVDVVLAPGQSADVAGSRVTVIAIDETSKRHRVRVTLAQPTLPSSQPAGEKGPPPTPPEYLDPGETGRACREDQADRDHRDGDGKGHGGSGLLGAKTGDGGGEEGSDEAEADGQEGERGEPFAKGVFDRGSSR
jgi:hypothetical protein